MDSIAAWVRRHAVLSCVAVGLFCLVGRAALLPVWGIPEPFYHDEFSYLLGADTFASGRLANPPHPLWVHFETFHVNMQPAYVSKYPPAQSLSLALGQRLLGHPWWGVWLVMGLFCAACCWMLQGYVSPGWAFAGGLLAVLQVGLGGYWINSYWGGGIPALGGALVLGAVARLARRPSPAMALTAAAGTLLLANSRPYEGLVTVLAASVLLGLWARREGTPVSRLFQAWVIVPGAALLVLGFAWMGYYNYRTTGSVATLPYLVNDRAYAAVPHFYLLRPKPVPPEYRHKQIATLWKEWDGAIYRKARANPATAVWPWFYDAWSKLAPCWLLLIVLAIVAVKVRRWEVWAALATVGVLCLAVYLETAVLAHYMAPVFCAVLVVEVGALAALSRTLRPGGRVFVFAVFAVAVFLNSVMVRYGIPHISGRPEVLASLEQSAGDQLVVVRYSPAHSVHEEWVWNKADIDRSRIVWAQDMGEANRELLDYYPSRKAWLLNADVNPPRLVPYEIK